MAFQLDSNVFHKQKSLSDYMAVNDARNLQRAQGEMGLEANRVTIDAAKQKQTMDMVGMGLAGATEADYPQRRQALIEQGMPEQLLPEQYNPALIDAIMTKAGYKAKPSALDQMMTLISPQGQAALQGAPLSQMMQPQPAQAAAPITPQGSITTASVGDIDQYAAESGQVPAPNASLDSIVSQARGMQGGAMPPANNQAMPEPTSVPVPQPLPTLQTRIPAPYQPKTIGAAYEADKAAAKASAEAAAPMSQKEQAEIAIKQAPIAEAKASKQRSQKGFDSIMDDMNTVYDDLDAAGAASSESKTWDENLGIYVTKTNPIAQAVGSVAGTKAQSIIQRLDPLKTRAKEQIMLATGMSSKAIDSNAEMKAFLASLTDVTNTREANAFTINTMQLLYGTPELAMARDAAIRSGQIEPMDFSKVGKSSGSTGGASGGGGAQPGGISEGATATNPKTGQKLVFKGGQWQAQ